MKKNLLLLALSLLVSGLSYGQDNADSMLNFISANRARAAVYLVQNDTVLVGLNENKMMPLASTLKIMVAIEFAKQAGLHVFAANTNVALKDLAAYYLPNTDGGAHPAWLAREKLSGNIKNDSIQLINVARGMIIFSSNANTEYLMDLLGLDNVKNNIQLLGIQKHGAFYPIVSSLFMYQNPRQKTEESILKSIKKLSEEQYGRFIYDMHKALKYDTVLKSKFRPQDLSLNMQRLWSDRLTASTAKDYAHICNVLNNRRYFTEETYAILSEVLESVMENPANQQWLKHAGMKGGSTAWVLTKALYATTKSGTKLEMTYFFNDLTIPENQKLQKWMNAFELKILSDQAFRKKFADTLRRS